MKHFWSGLALAGSLAVVAVAAQAQEGRYIVKFNAGHGAAGRAALGVAGAQVVLALDPQEAVAARIPAQALAGLSRNPHIEYIEEDVPRYPLATWNDRVRGSGGEIVPYGVQMVQADRISVANNSGMPKVCIIDSGYSAQHEDLRDQNTAPAISFSNNSGSGTWNQDSCGHGSHVAGTIQAIAGNNKGVVGVVQNVPLHIVKVFGNDALVDGGSCTWTYSSTLVDALNKCQAAGAKVTSMSLGGGAKSRTEENAFNNTYNQGMLHVAAAGNDGNRLTSYPAGYAGVISVAAVDANETVADFSQQNKDVELAAPGVGVLSTVPWLDYDALTFADKSSVIGGHVEFSGRTSGITAPLANGGLCDSVGSWSGKVVICQRGTISFFDKVTNAASGGAVAVVIYNNATSDATCGDFSGTLGDGNSSSVPAITVSCQEGTTALARVGQSGTVVSTFTAPSSDYEAWNGTSMATPHVSGVAALVWGCFPTATNVQIRNALDSSARDKGAPGRDPAYGYGIVQAVDALQALGGTTLCSVTTSSIYP